MSKNHVELMEYLKLMKEGNKEDFALMRADLKDLNKLVDTHEKFINNWKGSVSMLVIMIWAGISVIIETFKKFF